MIRTSSYTIYVDLPGDQSEMLLVHGYKGTYDKVSRPVARYLRSLERRRAPKPLYGDWSDEPAADESVSTPSATTIAVLKERGYLTELSHEAETAHFESIVGELHERNMGKMPNYIFMPTYDCNLRCSYCFQDHMRTDPKFRHLLRIMQPEMIDRIFTGMREIEGNHGHSGDGPRQRNIGFFGGEPLLAACRPAVEQIIDRALAGGTASFWAVTNGTELEAYEDLLGPSRLAALQVTLDGPPEEHDQRRIYADGSGSFARIADNISLALARGTEVNIRLNLDRNNIALVPALAAEIESRGWDHELGFSVYSAPIRAENAKTEARTTFNTWELEQALAAIHESSPDTRCIGRPDDAIKSNARAIFDGTGAAASSFRESFCSAHNRMYIFDVFGDVYACWERTGDPQVRIGKIAADGRVSINTPVQELWRSRTVASNPVCRQCRYALHCGGGCAVLALGKTGRYHSNFCDGFASRFRNGVAEAYQAHLHGVPPAMTAERVSDL